jgi:hypothetical protein
VQLRILLPLLTAAVACGGAEFTVRETPAEIIIDGPGYQAAVARQGFGLRITRGGETVLESAQAGDRAANLGFEHDGKQHQVTKLLSQRRTDAGVSFEYETTYAEAVARVDLRPTPGALRVTAWLLSSDGDLIPSLRYRLQPSGFGTAASSRASAIPRCFH